MMNVKILIGIMLIVVAAGAFYGGMQYQASKSPARGFRGSFAQRFGANTQSVRGKIISADANSLSLQKMDGSSSIVLYSNSTAITKAVSGSSSDLKSGEQVNVIGTQNSDGSVTAQFIQLNPIMRGSGPQMPAAQ